MVLAGPIAVARRQDGWTFEGQGTYGSVLSGRFYHLRVPAAEVDALNEMADAADDATEGCDGGGEGPPDGAPAHQECRYQQACCLLGTRYLATRCAGSDGPRDGRFRLRHPAEATVPMTAPHPRPRAQANV